MEREKLKPCPFCGGKANLYDNIRGFMFIMCADCRCSTSIKAFNTYQQKEDFKKKNFLKYGTGE